MYHVKEVPYTVPGDLDLNVSDEEEFSPDKLRATVERFYMTYVLQFGPDAPCLSFSRVAFVICGFLLSIQKRFNRTNP